MTDELTKPISAGQLLRQKREQRNLSVQQVALQLNLKPAQVEQLEQDQSVGAFETYSRGYVRAYGRLLKISAAELTAALAVNTGNVPSAAKQPMRTFSNRTAKQATESRFMWLTYGIIILLVILLFIWWWQTDKLSPVAEENATVLETEQIAPIVAKAITEPEPLEQTPEQLTVLLEQLEPETKTDAPEAIAPLPENDQLELRFSENCWVDVVDAEGNRLAFGTKQAGYIMQLTGKSPFVVTLGNPSVVKVNFNKQAIDMSALAAGRVAKLTIPESD